MAETRRCTGHCCERFTLPFSPEEMRERYDEALAYAHGEPPSRPMLIDIEVLYPMLIHLGEHGWSPQTGEPFDPEGITTFHHYTCRNFDTETRNCRIYERRPEMCSLYPYGQACRYEGCTRVETELVQLASKRDDNHA